jgi:DNA-binding HxlR family transcriptional regulator
MATTRTYGDRCGVARALDAIGERWALLIVRELLLGPKRFTDLRDGLPGASHNVLSHRLKELESDGIVERRRLPPPGPVNVYALTGRGYELEDLISALGRWGANTPVPPAEVPISVDSLVLSMRTLFDPDLAGDLSTTLSLRIEGQPFRATVGDGRLEVVRGEANGADAVIAADAEPLLMTIRGRRGLDDGGIAVAGDRAAVEAFVGLFPLPPVNAP